MFKVNSSGKILLYYLMSFLILKAAAYRLCATVFFAVWLVINDMDHKITGLGKVNGFCFQAGEERFFIFCVNILLNTVKFEWPKNGEV